MGKTKPDHARAWRRYIRADGRSAVLAAVLCTAFAGAGARAQPIPDAPQDFLFRYLQTLNLTLADTPVIDDLSGRFLNDAWSTLTAMKSNGSACARTCWR